MKTLNIILLTFFMSSCANYINKIHADLDRAEGTQQIADKRHDTTFNRFRNNSPSTATQPNMIPSVKRQYMPVNSSKKRYTANDLEDSGNSGSLWAGSGNENYLFTKNKWKRNGDIILINVQSKLKNDITLELKRAYPAIPSMPKKADPKDPTATAATANPATDPVDEKDVPEDDKVHDKISSVIVEEISKDHLLIRGQKFILFRNQKHLIEVQALISRKDILDDDGVNSVNFLESSLAILR